MSTRCVVNFRTEQHGMDAKVYRHSDGYPGTVDKKEYGVLADMQDFFEAVEEQTAGGYSGTRFEDPSYLAAKFVVWQADQFNRNNGTPLDFLSVGILMENPWDIEYEYEVWCDKRDPKTGRPLVTVHDPGAPALPPEKMNTEGRYEVTYKVFDPDSITGYSEGKVVWNCKHYLHAKNRASKRGMVDVEIKFLGEEVPVA